jgi:hypothetical protein
MLSRDPSPAPCPGRPTSPSRRTLLKGGLGAAGLLLLEGATGGRLAAAASKIGPSTTVAPYVFPVANGVDVTSILTVRDLKAANGYAMVGIPDGLGLVPGAGSFTLLMNHELGATAGVVRSHGSKGSFVSKWTIDTATLRVMSGADLTTSASTVYNWNPITKAYETGTVAWNRFCSADLPEVSAFQNGAKGTGVRIYMNGEENDNGRAWAHLVTGPNAGQSWQLPRLGRYAFENVVASPASQDKTIVIGLDDGSLSTGAKAENNPCELFVYIGTKQETGNEIERAGLTNGKLYAVRLPTSGDKFITEENNDFAFGTTSYVSTARFDLVQLGKDGDVSAMSGLELEQDCITKNAVRLQRIEDGAWDPRPATKNDFYFVTTASPIRNCRLWRLRFDDLDAPEKGGTLTALLKGNEGHYMFDNLAIDGLGRILLQEDPGNQVRNARIWVYGIDSGALTWVAQHDRAFFDPLLSYQKYFQTQDEESSGIIDASSVLGAGWFLLVVQSHNVISTTDPDLVEDGQLLAMYVPPTIK